MTPFEQYEALLQEAEPTAAKYLPSVDERVRELSAKLRDGRIQVMLFGAYNAGKSTLINALLGSEQARIGDVPTTDSVSEYDWDGHVLLDTPGVNAPIEHEEISRARLERTDLVLFILRQEDQDADDVMQRIFDLLEAKRPLFLLLNYGDSDPRLVAEMQLNLNRTLIRYAQQRGFDLDALGRVPVVLMNARTALKARLESKAKLREHSGYDEFMERFAEWLRRYDDETRRLEQTLGGIERVFLDPVHKAIDEKSSGAGETDELVRQIAHIRREGRVLSDVAANRVRTELAGHRPELAVVFDRATDAQQVIAEVEKIGDTVSDAVHTWLAGEFQASMERSIRALVPNGVLNVPGIERQSGAGLFDKSKNQALAGAKEAATKENIFEALKLGRSMKIPGLKGRWAKTLDKWAGKAGPVIQIGLALLEIFMAHRDEQKANQQMEDRAMQRNQWVEDICAQIRAGLMESIDESLKLLIDDLVHPLETQLQALRSAGSEVEQDRVYWSELATKFQSVRF